MKKTRIMAFGTFDGLHKGHLDLFKQSRALALNPYLIVSIARDSNVERIKGEKPLFNEDTRMKIVKKSSLVDKVVLGAKKDYLSHIVKEKPAIIALGYDQKYYVANLKNNLLVLGLKVKIYRLKSFKAYIYKNRLIKLKKLKPRRSKSQG
ncbi:MAG: adenylyltransferase/cytidyltransferase family protein [Candidatus Pacebacteria bacterium]|nr:adenylyltransferase/cytidyltransferase family protein [Candidatus Paceibacterota bacterium]MCF7862746.1 adenylyltransferase/cytidyltransferase family protein [Candidatus Paceibacterota bacterium]